MKSESIGLVQDSVTCVSPAVAVEAVTLLGEELSIVMVLLFVSVPAFVLVAIQLLTYGERLYVKPGAGGILACVFGVILILNVVGVVVTGSGVPPEKLTTLPTSEETAEKYVVVPSLDVILTSATPAYGRLDVASTTDSAVTESVPALAVSVNAPASTMVEDGETVVDDGSEPEARVVVHAPVVNEADIAPYEVPEELVAYARE